MLTTSEPAPGIDNFCKDCKYVIGRRYDYEYAGGWQCGHEKNVASKHVDPVTGLVKKNYIVVNCAECRGKPTMCGAQGVWFEQYIPPAPPAPPATKSKLSNISADDL